MTGRYPEIVSALRALAFDRFLMDGEIVALDARGAPSFQRLQARMGLTRPGDVARAMAAVPVEAVFFDCLALEGHDLRRLPLDGAQGLPRARPAAARRRALRRPRGGHGPAFLEAAAEARLEGIVAKRRGERLRPAALRRVAQDQVPATAGVRRRRLHRPPGKPGALRRAPPRSLRGRAARLRVEGRHGLRRRRARAALAPARAAPPRDVAVRAGTPAGRGHHWVEPRLVAEVRFTEWTRDGGLRHPTYLGLRDDVRPEDCRRETPDARGLARRRRAVADRSRSRRSATAADPQRAGPAIAAAGAAAPASRVRLTNLDKVFWPAEGYTKGDLIGYYDAIAPAMLPYLRDRPIVLTRYPDGIAGKSFFQKDAPEFAPDWVRTERVYSKDTDRDIDYFVVDDAEALRYVANMGTIPIHAWSARVPALERPDWLVLDLDPKGAPFTDVVRVAQAVHRVLDELEVPSHVKTSGATGLHVLVPLGAQYTHEQSRTLARLLATLVVEAVPAIATLARPLGARGGKVYVDFGQNGHGRTIAAPFSVRPLPGAPVSCPLDWTRGHRAARPGPLHDPHGAATIRATA